MTNLKRWLQRPLQPVPLKVAIILLVIALLGFADASYLTIEHYRGVIPPCSVVSGCETVLTSTYSKVLGIPVSLLGVVFYLVLLVGVFAYIDTKKTFLLKWTLALTFFGFIGTLWFLYLQAFVLHSFCVYCLGSAATSTLLFMGAIWVFSKYTVTDTLAA